MSIDGANVHENERRDHENERRGHENERRGHENERRGHVRCVRWCTRRW